MERTLSAAALAACLVAATGCASTHPPAEPGPAVPRLAHVGGAEHQHLEKSWETVERACLTHERKLRHEAARAGSTRRIAETVLAGTAGALTIGTAVYAGRADPPSGNVVVPLTAAAAAAAVPLVVLLAQGNKSDEHLVERERRVSDRRHDVREAHDALLATRQERVRAEHAFADLNATLPQHRLDDGRRRPGAASPAPDAALPPAKPSPAAGPQRPPAGPQKPPPAEPGDGPRGPSARDAVERAAGDVELMRAGLLAQARAELSAAKRREHEAADALDRALNQLFHVCGRDRR